MSRIAIDVAYPTEGRRIALRTQLDWDRDVEPVLVEGAHAHFVIETNRRSLRYKPVLFDEQAMHWALGANRVAFASEPEFIEYPRFFEEACTACDIVGFETHHGDHSHEVRVFLPPGYDENPLQRYPVVYMQDGHNVFFAEESAFGAHWRVVETLSTLNAMNALSPVIVVGIYPHDRMVEYTVPGVEHYGAFLVQTLKPRIDAEYRTLPGREHTAIMGSSLGGVAAFWVGWTHPATFGQAASLSATFGYRDDLAERVDREPVPPTRFYLDSGWPGDNYEAVRDLRARLVRRGLVPGSEMLYLAFPRATHSESSWAARLHIPFQFLFDEARQ
ncbi:MAG: alpha/beta hydrolase-fold protein [Myxococcota bacterium]